MITPEQLAKSATEHGHQSALFCWANGAKQQYPQLEWLHAIPNGGLRDKITAGKLKAEGVKSGVPDIFLPVPQTIQHPFSYQPDLETIKEKKLRATSFGWSQEIHGLYIELKIGKNKPTDDQHKWIDYLISAGYMCYVAYGWEDARDCILAYLKE